MSPERFADNQKKNGTDLRPPRSTNHEWEKNARLTPASQAQNTNGAESGGMKCPRSGISALQLRGEHGIDGGEKRRGFKRNGGGKENANAQRELFHGGFAALVKST